MSSSASSVAAIEVDAGVWRAVAGGSVQIPSANSYVYYFLEGHVEHCSPSLLLHNYSFALKRPMIPCQVLSVRFLSDPTSELGFVKFLLQPVIQPFAPGRPGSDDDDGGGGENDVVSFAKILTPSDANNGGGFSVPRFCADVIFPQLDFEAEPPVQNLVLMDVCNHAWEFRHIYRGTPRRHLLTTGWSKFVNSKRLVAGDSVVFMRKKSTRELFVGIRRAAMRSGRSIEGRDGGEVLEALEKVSKGMAFEVVYYPKFGLPDFVVSTEKVKEALKIGWITGMRVRMPVETEDSSRTTWYQGTVETSFSSNGGPWVGSPWRMLQVSWDDPDGLLNMHRVSPWVVERIQPTDLPGSQFLASKKFKIDQNLGMLHPNGNEERYLPTTNLTRPTGLLNSEIVNYPFSSGMQGVRLDNMNISQLTVNKFYQTMQEFPENDKEPEVRAISTALSIGSSCPDSLSPHSQSSIHLPITDQASKLGRSSSPTASSSSFQLFGKVIQMLEPM